MHRSFLALWPECATRSNLRACEKGRTTRRIKRSSTTEEYLLRAGTMMSICERVNAVECHSIALYEVILQEMWQNLLYLVGRSRLWFSASHPYFCGE